jgi:hypothetical protein
MPDYTVVLDGILLVLSSLLVQPPPVLNRPTTEQLYVVNSGLSRLQNGHQDLYEPGTQGGRAYMQGLLSIWQTDLVDVATAAIKLIEREVIEVDVDTIEVEVN